MDIDTTIDCEVFNRLPNNLPSNNTQLIDVLFEYLDPERKSIIENLYNENANVQFRFVTNQEEQNLTLEDYKNNNHTSNIRNFLNNASSNESANIVVISVGDSGETQDVPINNHSNEPIFSYGDLLKPFLGSNLSKNKLEEASHLERLVSEYKKSTCMYNALLQKYYQDDKVISSGGLFHNTLGGLLVANRIRLIYTSLIYRLIKMYQARKNAYRLANRTSYLDQIDGSRYMGDYDLSRENGLTQDPSNFIGVNTKETFENMNQNQLPVYDKQLEVVVPKDDEALAADLKVALEEEYRQQPTVPLALPKSTSMDDVEQTGRKIIVQDVVQKKNLQTKLVELRNQVEYMQRVNRTVYYRKLAMYLFLAVVLCMLMYVMLR